jgi:hypothetical protein
VLFKGRRELVYLVARSLSPTSDSVLLLKPLATAACVSRTFVINSDAIHELSSPLGCAFIPKNIRRSCDDGNILGTPVEAAQCSLLENYEIKLDDT